MKEGLILLMALMVACGTSGCNSTKVNNGGNGGNGGPAYVYSTVSGLPNPATGNVAQPTGAGTAASLEVLNWAGFKGAVSYTFDDSSPSQIEHYQELQATGVRMTFYVSNANNWIANYDATWTQAVKDGHEIGNHTVHHLRASLIKGAGEGFGTLPAGATQDTEIQECTDYIIQNFEQAGIFSMATPYGDNNWEAYAQKYFPLCRAVGGATVAPNDSTNPMRLPCYMVNNDTESNFNTKIDVARSNEVWQIFLTHTIYPTTNDWSLGANITDIAASVTHAKALNDVWIDTLGNVGLYWLAQKVFNGVTPTVSGNTTTWDWSGSLPANFPAGKYLRVKVDGGTLQQGGQTLTWDEHGYYEVALDAGSLTLIPKPQ